jgi:aryl-alcohol dehydrogenase-like predicted oxidoreductase
MKKIEKSKLGKTGLTISRLGFGSMELRGPKVWGGRVVDEKNAERVLNRVLDEGINFIDTAHVYGTSEELIGKFVAHRRSEYVLATKCGVFIDADNNTQKDCDASRLMNQMETSLRLLKTDHVDLIQLHNPPVEMCRKQGAVETLIKMKEQGKAKHIGISTFFPDVPEYAQWGVFETFQLPYSALERVHEDAITGAFRRGIGVIIRGGVGQGEPSGGIKAESKWAKFEAAGLDELRSEGESRTEWMLRFTLTHPHACTVIVGTSNPDHLAANINALRRGPLPANVYAEAKTRLDAAGIKVTPFPGA